MSENNQTNSVNLDLLFIKKIALILDDHTIFAEAFAKTLQALHFLRMYFLFQREVIFWIILCS